ncbi:hypothetical protein FACS189429_1850 [Bacteroidia bacterium]|nr:hypothetical protein FACS189429_1850 [Bacteroidia bacterium]GHV44108.1 hypothetical protein FACS1894180_5010 [Bacteroidia bacterium]
MKKNIFISVVLVFMLIITSIGFFPSILSFLIAQGSDCLLTLVNSNVFLQIFFIVLIILCLFFRKKIRKHIFCFLITISAIMWLMSGRTIGHIPYPDDKIITGWFCFPTSNMYMCNSIDDDMDCETLLYNTTIEKRPFWFILLKNKKRDELIFVGPVIWNKTINSLQDFYILKKDN